MSYSIDLVKRNEDGHRFVVLNDDAGGDSLLFDMSSGERQTVVLTFGQFNEPDWSYIPFEEATPEEKAHIEILKEKHYWADWIESKLECHSPINYKQK